MSYTAFLWKSSNAHGIHSPFMYSFVANGIYGTNRRLVAKRRYSGISTNSLEVLFRVMAYFKSFKMMAYGENDAAITEAIREVAEVNKTQLWFYSPLAPVAGGLDVGIICGSDTNTVNESFYRLLQDANNNTVFVLPDIYRTPKLKQAWENLKKNPNVTVTADTYHLGILFIRKGQAKQHFTVRPFTSFFTDAVLGIKNLWGLF